MNLSVDILLEFLYTFAVTFIFCFIGSLMRESFKSTKRKRKKSRMLDINRIVTSTMFSTFLMCACADYVDLQIGMYAILSVLCGIWGLTIFSVIVNKKFLSLFLINMAKKKIEIDDSILESAITTASEILEEEENENDHQKNNKNIS